MDRGPIILKQRPVLGISACCMGCPVRYNARGFDLLKNLGREKGDFTWCPVCPECQAGLGVARDPIHIAGANGAAVWLQEATVRSRNGHDVTDKVISGAKESLNILKRAGTRAFVYMDGSPTCGVYRTTLKKQNRGKPPGVFGALLDQEGFFLIPALDLQSPLRWWDWRRRLLAFTWLQDVPIHTKGELYEVWYRMKFICQELDDPWARWKGQQLAGLGKKISEEEIGSFRREVGDLLRKPSSPGRLSGSLWKHYAHYRKVTGQSVPDISQQGTQRNITTIARELVRLERASIEDQILFGTAPVIYSAKKTAPSSLNPDEPAELEANQKT